MSSLRDTRMTLLQRLPNPDDREAWAEFQVFYWPLITGWARALGCSPTLAEDIYQATAVQLMARLDTFRPSGEAGSFRKWLKTLVKNKVYDHYRWEGKHRAPSRPDADPDRWELPGAEYGEQADGAAQGEAEMDRIWMNGLLDRAMAAARKRVKPEKWEAFRRYAIEEEPAERVSTDLGITQGSLFQQKSSFLDMVREELVALLGEYNDLTMEWRSTPEARRALRSALDDYLRECRAHRATVVVAAPPAELFRRLQAIQAILARLAALTKGPGLVVSVPDAEPYWFPLTVPSLSLGRGEECGLRLEAEGVSGRHCVIEQGADGWAMHDAGSTNGTWRNGERIAASPLGEGDHLALGAALVICLGIERQP